MPRALPRKVEAGKDGVGMSVKRCGEEEQPSLLAGPNWGSTSVKPPGVAVQIVAGKAVVQSTPLLVTFSVKAAVDAVLPNGANQM